jgi:hypothetical protein
MTSQYLLPANTPAKVARLHIKHVLGMQNEFLVQNTFFGGKKSSSKRAPDLTPIDELHHLKQELEDIVALMHQQLGSAKDLEIAALKKREQTKDVEIKKLKQGQETINEALMKRIDYCQKLEKELARGRVMKGVNLESIWAAGLLPTVGETSNVGNTLETGAGAVS